MKIYYAGASGIGVGKTLGISKANVYNWIKKTSETLPAAIYCTDGWSGCVDVIYPGKYVRNIRDKSNIFTVESVNADLLYILLLARRSRCFARKIETLRAVIEVFVDAYNKFCEAKMKFRRNRDIKSRELPFSVLDFL